MNVIIKISAVLFLLLFSSACEDNPPKKDIVIYGLGVDFSPYDAGTGKAGDFIYSISPPPPEKVFLEFGAPVIDVSGNIKHLPTFEYRIDKNAELRAIAEGIVDRMYVNSEGDYEIVVHYTPNDDFFVVYDHITNLKVGVGDKIVPGQVLGNPGAWDDTYGRFEIMINNYHTKLSYCPFVYFDPALKDEYEQKVNLFIQEWESFKGDGSIYDEGNYPYAGCRMANMASY